MAMEVKGKVVAWATVNSKGVVLGVWDRKAEAGRDRAAWSRRGACPPYRTAAVVIPRPRRKGGKA